MPEDLQALSRTLVGRKTRIRSRKKPVAEMQEKPVSLLSAAESESSASEEGHEEGEELTYLTEYDYEGKGAEDEAGERD